MGKHRTSGEGQKEEGQTWQKWRAGGTPLAPDLVPPSHPSNFALFSFCLSVISLFAFSLGVFSWNFAPKWSSLGHRVRVPAAPCGVAGFSHIPPKFNEKTPRHLRSATNASLEHLATETQVKPEGPSLLRRSEVSVEHNFIQIECERWHMVQHFGRKGFTRLGWPPGCICELPQSCLVLIGAKAAPSRACRADDNSTTCTNLSACMCRLITNASDTK